MAHLSQRHGPCMDDKFHHAIRQIYIIIINGTLSQLVMAIITGHSPCMDKEFQHPNDIHRFCITGPLDMMMMMVGWIIK
jgi:hypothetical protein